MRFTQPSYEPAGEEPGSELGDAARRLLGPLAALRSTACLKRKTAAAAADCQGPSHPERSPCTK
jgi:hypothetical protein